MSGGQEDFIMAILLTGYLFLCVTVASLVDNERDDRNRSWGTISKEDFVITGKILLWGWTIPIASTVLVSAQYAKEYVLSNLSTKRIPSVSRLRLKDR